MSDIQVASCAVDPVVCGVFDLAPERSTTAFRAPRPGPSTRMAVFGMNLYVAPVASLVREIATPVPPGQGPRLIVTANLDHVVRLAENKVFRDAYDWAWVVTADGWPVQFYAQLRCREPVPRITGADLFPVIAAHFDPAIHRLFFVVPTAAAIERTRAWMIARGFADDAIDFHVPTFGFEQDFDASMALARRIAQHQTTHLVMAIGAPKSECWCYEHRAFLGDCHILCVGAALEFATGLKQRAPLAWRRLGLECLWRYVHEPRRLFRRYFVDSWRFLPIVWADLRSGATPPDGPPLRHAEPAVAGHPGTAP